MVQMPFDIINAKKNLEAHWKYSKQTKYSKGQVDHY